MRPDRGVIADVVIDLRPDLGVEESNAATDLRVDRGVEDPNAAVDLRQDRGVEDPKATVDFREGVDTTGLAWVEKVGDHRALNSGRE